MSAFADAFQVAHAPQMAYFGDRVRITPTAPSGGKARYVVGGVDTSRPVFVGQGIFDGDPIAAKVTGAGANSRDNAEVETGRYTVSLAWTDFAGRPLPVKGDLVDVLDPATDSPVRGRPGYKIVTVEPDDTAEIVCHLVERSSAP